MESLTIRLDDGLSKKINNFLSPYYSTKTEFVREAIREKIKSLENEVFLRKLQKEVVAKRKTPLTIKETEKLLKEMEKVSDSDILRKYNLQTIKKI